MAREYIPGDYNVICDRTGYKVKASKTRKEWNGLRVRRESWEPRHPQDKIRGVPDHQAVPDPRPWQTDRFLDTGDVSEDDL